VLQWASANAAGTALLGPVLLATTGAQSKAGGEFRPTGVDTPRLTSKPYEPIPPGPGANRPGNGNHTDRLGALKGAWQPSTVYQTGDTNSPSGQRLHVRRSRAAAAQSARRSRRSRSGHHDRADHGPTNGLTWTCIFHRPWAVTARYRNQVSRA